MKLKVPSVFTVLGQLDDCLPIGDWCPVEPDHATDAIEWLHHTAKQVLSERLACDGVDWVSLGQLMLAYESKAVGELRCNGMLSGAVIDVPLTVEEHDIVTALQLTLRSRRDWSERQGGRKGGEQERRQNKPEVQAVREWYTDQRFDPCLSMRDKFEYFLMEVYGAGFERYLDKHCGNTEAKPGKNPASISYKTFTRWVE